MDFDTFLKNEETFLLSVKDGLENHGDGQPRLLTLDK